MRVSRTPLALAALLLVAACGTSPEIVAPESTLRSGTWIGSGNYIADSTYTAERGGGAGLIGSGN